MNRLQSLEDRKARCAEMRALLEAGEPEHGSLVRAIEGAYGRRLKVLIAEVRNGGGIDGVTAPALLIDSLGTAFDGGCHAMVNATTRERLLHICRAVGDELGVDWVGAMHVGHFRMLEVVWWRDDASTIKDRTAL